MKVENVLFALVGKIELSSCELLQHRCNLIGGCSARKGHSRSHCSNGQSRR